MSADGFAAVPNWLIREAEVSIYALVVYAALASHSGKGGIRPSIATIATEARCSVRKVHDALKELVGVGAIVVERRRTAAGDADTNVYHLRSSVVEEPEGGGAHGALPVVHDVQGVVHDVQGGGAHGAQEEEPLKKNPSTRGSARSATTIPDIFVVTAEMRSWAETSAPAVLVDRETDIFVRYWREGNGRGKRHKDWVATWKNWLLKSQTDAERRGWQPPSSLVAPRNITEERLARERALVGGGS